MNDELKELGLDLGDAVLNLFSNAKNAKLDRQPWGDTLKMGALRFLPNMSAGSGMNVVVKPESNISVASVRFAKADAFNVNECHRTVIERNKNQIYATVSNYSKDAVEKIEMDITPIVWGDDAARRILQTRTSDVKKILNAAIDANYDLNLLTDARYMSSYDYKPAQLECVHAEFLRRANILDDINKEGITTESL